MSYINTLQLEREVLLVERVDDLSNLILELRRSEKNFLLYHDPAVFTQGVGYMDKADTLLGSLSKDLRGQEVKTTGVKLKQSLDEYRTLLGRITPDKGNNSAAIEALDAGKIRDVGQNLVKYSKSISKFERKNILQINKRQRSTLMLSMVGIAVVVLVLVLFVSSNILRPLSQVQAATKKISLGTFKPIPIKNSHDEIQQVFAALNSMVEQLTQRREQLVQAQKLSSIGTLASGIAHQLNNPLNNISTSCQILKEGGKPGSLLEEKMMNNIMQETLRARDIVKGLLEFSREREYSPAPVELNGIIQSAISLVSSQVPSNVVMGGDIPEDITVMVDRRKMQEALINLLINAIQAIGNEEGAITVAATTNADNAVISISDTGQGIDQKTLERIFDPFFSTKEVGQGTGLGLYIVYGIIKKHQGHIRVESEPGKGTTFNISLPLVKPGDAIA